MESRIVLLLTMCFSVLMFRGPTRSNRTDTLFPYTTLFRSKTSDDGRGRSDDGGDAAMKNTYRAMQVTTPGTLELVERETPEPGVGEVLIVIEACGICGADVGDIEGAHPSLQPPRVSGHEVVGRIVTRPEERRVGQGCVRTCRSRCRPYH